MYYSMVKPYLTLAQFSKFATFTSPQTVNFILYDLRSQEMINTTLMVRQNKKRAGTVTLSSAAILYFTVVRCIQEPASRVR